jgi:hypothetical protein
VEAKEVVRLLELDNEEKDLLAELVTHGGWKVYQKLLVDLRDDILTNFKAKIIKKQEDLIEMAKEQARLELVENVVIPIIRDYLEEEEK